jgi:hypothetical protein
VRFANALNTSPSVVRSVMRTENAVRGCATKALNAAVVTPHSNHRPRIRALAPFNEFCACHYFTSGVLAADS